MKRNSDLDLRLLRCFVAVADRSSFRAAAEWLHVAQPWLSRSITHLEQSLGVELFKRNTRAVRTSDAGKLLLPLARRLIKDAEAFAQHAQNLSERSIGLVRLGTAHFLGDLPVRTRLVENFIAQYPQYRIEVRTAWLDRLVEAVRSGEIDVALVAAPPQNETLTSIAIQHSPLELVVPQNSKLARKNRITAHDLRGVPVGIWREVVGAAPLHQQLATLLRTAGAETRLMPDDNFAACLQYAARMAIAVPGPSALLDRVTLPAGMRRKPLDVGPAVIDIALLRRRQVSTPALDALWTLAESIAGS